MSAIHSKQTSADGIHIIHSFEYADAAARTGATGLTALDVGKAAKQIDALTWWVLTNHSPVTWTQLGSGTAVIAKSTLTWGNSGVSSTTTTRYLSPGYGDVLGPTTVVQFRIPYNGTLNNLRVRHNTTAGNGNAIVYTLRVNGSTSTLTCSVNSTTADGSDVTHSVTVSAGDLVDIEVTKASSIATSPSDIMASMEYDAT